MIKQSRRISLCFSSDEMVNTPLDNVDNILDIMKKAAGKDYSQVNKAGWWLEKR